MREPIEVFVRFLGRFADDRHVQVATNHFRDLAKRHTFFRDTVIGSPLGTFFKSEPEERRRIKSVHGRPAVAPVADVSGSSFFARYINKGRNKTVIAVAMDRWRKTNHGHT